MRCCSNLLYFSGDVYTKRFLLLLAQSNNAQRSYASTALKTFFFGKIAAFPTLTAVVSSSAAEKHNSISKTKEM